MGDPPGHPFHVVETDGGSQVSSFRDSREESIRRTQELETFVLETFSSKSPTTPAVTEAHYEGRYMSGPGSGLFEQRKLPYSIRKFQNRTDGYGGPIYGSGNNIYEQRLHEAATTIKRKDSELEEHVLTLQGKNSLLAEKDISLAEKDAQLLHDESRAANLEKENGGYKSQLAEKEKLIALQNERMSEQKVRLQEVQSDVVRLKEENLKVTSRTSKVSKVAFVHKGCEDKATVLKLRVEELGGQVADRDRMLNTKNSQAKEKSKASKLLEAELREDVKILKLQVEEEQGLLAASTAKFSAEIAQQEQQLKGHKDWNKSLSELCEALKDRVEEMASEHKALDELRAARLETYEELVATQQIDVEDLNAQLASQNELIVAFKVEAQQHQTEINAENDKVEVLRSLMAGKSGELAESLNTIANNKSKLQQLHKDLSARQTEVDGLRSLLADRDVILMETKNGITNFKSQVQQSRVPVPEETSDGKAPQLHAAFVPECIRATDEEKERTESHPVAAETPVLEKEKLPNSMSPDEGLFESNNMNRVQITIVVCGVLMAAWLAIFNYSDLIITDWGLREILDRKARGIRTS